MQLHVPVRTGLVRLLAPIECDQPIDLYDKASHGTTTTRIRVSDEICASLLPRVWIEKNQVEAVLRLLG